LACPHLGEVGTQAIFGSTLQCIEYEWSLATGWLLRLLRARSLGRKFFEGAEEERGHSGLRSARVGVLAWQAEPEGAVMASVGVEAPTRGRGKPRHHSVLSVRSTKPTLCFV
jgi:hypothetical protein